MTIRPTPFARWGFLALLWACAGLFLSLGLASLLQGPPRTGYNWGATGFFFLIALVCFLVGLLTWSMYIEVSDSVITLRTLLSRRRFQRDEIVAIWAHKSRLSSLTYFRRDDGTLTAFGAGYLWGEAQLRSLADSLGVPLELMKN
jgi:hypothetical protein